jgi:hypothetical protein
VDEKIIIKWMLGKYSRRMWSGIISIRIRDDLEGSCQYSNELSGPVKGREFLD